MKNKINPSELKDDIYKGTRIGIRVVLLIVVFFITGVLFNFPIKTIIKNLITKQLETSCPIKSKNMDISLFLPKISIEKAVIPGSCFNKPISNYLNIEKLDILFMGPSFYPIGLKFKINVKDKYLKTDTYFALSFNSLSIRVEKTELNSKFLYPLLDGAQAIQGSFNIDTKIILKKKGIEEMFLLIKSKDFSIPTQEIKSFEIPHLPIGDLSLVGSLAKSVFTIKNFSLGNINSPITANITGKVSVNTKNMNASKLNLDANMNFTKDFLENFEMITLFIQGKESDNGKYKLKITGNLESPSINAL